MSRRKCCCGSAAGCCNCCACCVCTSCSKQIPAFQVTIAGVESSTECYYEICGPCSEGLDQVQGTFTLTHDNCLAFNSGQRGPCDCVWSLCQPITCNGHALCLYINLKIGLDKSWTLSLSICAPAGIVEGDPCSCNGGGVTTDTCQGSWKWRSAANSIGDCQPSDLNLPLYSPPGNVPPTLPWDFSAATVSITAEPTSEECTSIGNPNLTPEIEVTFSGLPDCGGIVDNDTTYLLPLSSGVSGCQYGLQIQAPSEENGWTQITLNVTFACPGAGDWYGTCGGSPDHYYLVVALQYRIVDGLDSLGGGDFWCYDLGTSPYDCKSVDLTCAFAGWGPTGCLCNDGGDCTAALSGTTAHVRYHTP